MSLSNGFNYFLPLSNWLFETKFSAAHMADQQKITWKDPIISVSTLPQKAPGGKKVLEELLSAKKALSYL